MSTEENKALARRIFEEAGSQGNYAVIDEAIAPTFVYRATNLADTHGPADLKDFFTRHRRAAPDIHYTIEELVAEGEKVVVHWTITGTQQGDLGGLRQLASSSRQMGSRFFALLTGTLWMEGLSGILSLSCNS